MPLKTTVWKLVTVVCSVSITVMLIMEYGLSFMLRKWVSVVLCEGAHQVHIPSHSTSWCQAEASVPNPRMEWNSGKLGLSVACCTCSILLDLLACSESIPQHSAIIRDNIVCRNLQFIHTPTRKLFIVSKFYIFVLPKWTQMLITHLCYT